MRECMWPATGLGPCDANPPRAGSSSRLEGGDRQAFEVLRKPGLNESRAEKGRVQGHTVDHGGRSD